MASKFYVEGEARASKVEDLFATIASRYDLINDLQSFGLHRIWKRRLLQAAAIRPGDKALDVCCGTGDVTFALAAAGAEATGFDFSEPMLAVARRRASEANPHQGRPPHFQQGDALNLPFSDATFDVVTISYGLRNLADFDRGVRELARVLRPEGRLLVLDFGIPANPGWRWGYFQYLRWLVPLFGRLFCGDRETHAYILDSLIRYPGQLAVDAKLRDLGFTETRVHDFLGGAMSLNYGRRAPSPQICCERSQTGKSVAGI